MPRTSTLFALLMSAVACSPGFGDDSTADSDGTPDTGSAHGDPTLEVVPTRGHAPLEVWATFDDLPDGAVVTWDFVGADETSANRGTWTEPGTWSVAAAITFADGQESSVTRTVEVLDDDRRMLFSEHFETDPFGAGTWQVFLDDCGTERDGTVEYVQSGDRCGTPAGYITRGGKRRCVVYSGRGFSTAGYRDLDFEVAHRDDGGGVIVHLRVDGTWSEATNTSGSGSSWQTATRAFPDGADIDHAVVYLEDGGGADCMELSGTPIAQPRTAQSCEGQTTALSASLDGATAWQWSRDGVALADGDGVRGATSATLVLEDLVADDAGTYTCAVTVGGRAIVSNPAVVELGEAARITLQPSSVEVTGGQPATLSVRATGSGALTYAWYRDGVALSDGGGLSGSITATLSLSAATPADAGAYQVVVTDDCGEVTSQAADLVVRTWDDEQTLRPGGSVTFDLSHDQDWILEGEFTDCHVPKFERYLRREDRLDLFDRGDDMLALRFANRKIWFVSAAVGELSSAVGETDHWGQSVEANIETGAHSWRIEYLVSQSRGLLYWDDVLVGDWGLQIDSIPGDMGTVDVGEVGGGTVRSYQGGFTPLADL